MSGLKSENFAERNQAQAIKWLKKNTEIATLIIFIIPAFILMNSKNFLKLLLYLINLRILNNLNILKSLYSLGNLASLSSLTLLVEVPELDNSNNWTGMQLRISIKNQLFI